MADDKPLTHNSLDEDAPQAPARETSPTASSTAVDAFPGVQVWLANEGVESCGDLTAVRGRIQTIASMNPQSGGGVGVFLGLKADRAGVGGQILVKRGQEILFEKSVAAPSCTDVVEALILSLEIYADEGESGAPKPTANPPASPASNPAPRDWPGPDLDPFAEEIQAPAPSPPLPRVDRPMLLVGATKSWSALPSNAAGTSGGAFLARIPVAGSWFMTGEARHLGAKTRVKRNAEYRFSATSLLLGPGIAHQLNRTAILRLDGALVCNLIQAAFDDANSQGVSAAGVSAGAALHGAIDIFLSRSVFLELRAGGSALVFRGRYVNDAQNLIWDQPFGSAVGGLLVGWAGGAADSNPTGRTNKRARAVKDRP